MEDNQVTVQPHSTKKKLTYVFKLSTGYQI